MDHRPTVGFVALRLHDRSDNSWAVIEQPSGAIALDAQLRLLMKLDRSQAVDLAAAMTYALEDNDEDQEAR